jgi:multidrug efflux pump subunit AcrA (membrane-fusion protein)
MTLRRPRTFRVAVRAAIALIAVAAIATAAVAATASNGTTYRTAVASRSTVSEELELTGTIEPVAQAAVAFPIAGTVAVVAAKVGQTVTTGQTLATLDPSTLQADLTSKEAALAAAQLTLEKARNGESTGGGVGGPTANGATPAPSATNAATASSAAASNTDTTASGSRSSAAISAARQAVSRDQRRVTAALAAALAASKTATDACTATTPTSTTSTTSPSGPDPQACATALAKTLRSLQALATAEQALAKDQSTLSQLLESAPTTPAQSTTPTTSDAARTPTTVTYTAQQLAAYEAAAAAAAADVAAAEEALAQATIVSPIKGTIATVNLVAGATVSAASSTGNIVIVSNGGFEVTTTATVAQRAKVKVGDSATVVVDGTSTKLSGKVVAIGAATTSNGTTTYPIVVGFTSTPTGAGATAETSAEHSGEVHADATGNTGLRNGASASLSIVVGHSVNALSVPTSAVHSVGTLHTVTVLSGGKPTTVRVELGTTGAERTVITSGLKAGQVVVLAALGAAIPSAGTNTGQFGGGGLGGGLGGNRTFGGPTRFGG